MRPAQFIAAVLLPALLVSGCSIAGMPAFKGAPIFARAAAPASPKPAERPATAVAVNDAAPVSALFGYAPIQSGGPTAVNSLIRKYSGHYNVPESLIHRVVKRESNYNPGARNGPYYGLMQISHATARSMGYSGSAAGLLDADTNLRYAVKYLAGAYLVSGGNQDRAMRLYASGYYYDAKRKGLLEETGLR